jgi:hypothetical protein
MSALTPSTTATSAPAPARAATLRTRRFGDRLADLELELSGRDPGRVVADLLRACCVGPDGEPLGEEWFLDLPLGERLAALLALAGGDGSEPFAAMMRCVSCAETLEAPLAVADLLAYQARAAAPQPLPLRVDDQHVLALRLPTARDLERWRDQGTPAEHLARELIQDDGTLPEPLPGAWLAAIEATLAGADPLVDFRLAIACPACGTSARYELDLQELALARLRATHTDLLRCVHRLASAYHWTEEQILAVPPSRRRAYLAMIEDAR